MAASRAFLVTEVETRRYRVTMSEDHWQNAFARGGDQELELCVCDQLSDPHPDNRVELLTVANTAEAVEEK